MYKAKGIITNFKVNPEKLGYEVKLKTETTHTIKVETENNKDEVYNCFFNDESKETKLVLVTDSFDVDVAMMPLISMLAVNNSKAIFGIDDIKKKIISVEIENNAK